jgi:hypothetical protein
MLCGNMGEHGGTWGNMVRGDNFSGGWCSPKIILFPQR